MEDYFILHSNCLPVKGYQQSIIADIQLDRYIVIPNMLYDLLIDSKTLTYKALKVKYKESEKGIEKFFEYFVKEDYGFFFSEPERFPALNLDWEIPTLISNSILEYNSFEKEKISALLNQLSVLGCKAIQLKFYFPIQRDEFVELIEILEYCFFEHIEVYSHYSKASDVIVSYIEENGSIIKLLCFSKCGELKRETININDTLFIFFSPKDDLKSLHCGFINTRMFVSNIQLFTEAQRHNTCLNRKIAIDVEGNIKNCPSMPQSYGNIKDTTLKEALEHPDFKKYWYIHKDQIEVCKDCEFRYICTDCRAYLEDPHNLYSKPLKCGYNPYTCEWEEWSTNPLKQKAIEYYGMQELVKKETD